MPTLIYLRGAPGSGKNTVARLLERDLKWPRLWVHHFDAIYRAIGDYKVPELTDELMLATIRHMAASRKDFIVVRPTRSSLFVSKLWAEFEREKISYRANKLNCTVLPVRLTASYDNLVTRVTRRWSESPFRLTTKEALDEYLEARPESTFPGEYVIDTDELTPEQVAGKIKELLP